MKLRIRYNKGLLNVGKDITQDSTLYDLKKEIESLSNIPIKNQCLKVGYPLKIIQQTNNCSIKSCGISNGDQIILEECKDIDMSSEHYNELNELSPAEITPTSTSNSMTENSINVDTTSSTPTPTGPPKAKPGPIPTMPHSSIDNSNKNIVNNNSEYSNTNENKKYKLISNGKGVYMNDELLIVKDIPDDNSCLFQSIRYVLQKDEISISQLRNIISDEILKNPIEYNDAILGKSRKDYINFIKKPLSWGGYIELQILSNYFETEIYSLDIETGRLDKFGEGKYKNIVFIVYSGIHYDAIAVTPFENAPKEYERTLFDRNEAEEIIQVMKILGKSLKDKHLFTDTSTFDLKCNVCGKGLKGEKEAVKHAQSTGHVDFKEYS